MTILQYYQKVHNLSIRESNKVSNLKLISNDLYDVQIEQCYNIEVGEHTNLTTEELRKLEWLLMDPLDRTGLSQKKYLEKKNNSVLIEIGPR